MTENFLELPDDLPVPQDDGACNHLKGKEIPFDRILRDLRKPPKFPTSCGNGCPSTSCASQDAVDSALTCTGCTDFYVANRTFAFLVEVPFPT